MQEAVFALALITAQTRALASAFIPRSG